MSRWLNPKSGDKVSATNPKRVVHISSVAGQIPAFAAPMYCASKHAISGFVRSLAPLDEMGIRVNGVAPGMIRTPLWTDHPEKSKMLDEEKDAWVEPDEVARALLRCCEDPEIVGGYVMEVLKDATRNVEWFNAPAPTGPGATVSNRDVMGAEVFEWLGERGWGTIK